MDNPNAKISGHDRWVFIDLEMTGLDETNCVILQAAMIIVDPQFRELAVMDIPIWQPESALETMSPFVRDMHTKNGLLRRVRSSTLSVQEAEAQLMGSLSQHAAYRRGVLAGNTVHFDRRFLQRYMPTLDGYLHYRHIDVSSLKIICQEWFGNHVKTPKKNNSHTALEDLRESIDELKFYRENCFRRFS